MKDLAEKYGIHFSDHALKRLKERFAESEVKIPYGLIVALSREQDGGEAFRVRQGDVAYICRNVTNGILVVTVMAHNNYRVCGKSKRVRKPQGNKRRHLR